MSSAKGRTENTLRRSTNAFHYALRDRVAARTAPAVCSCLYTFINIHLLLLLTPTQLATVTFDGQDDDMSMLYVGALTKWINLAAILEKLSPPVASVAT